MFNRLETNRKTWLALCSIFLHWFLNCRTCVKCYYAVPYYQKYVNDFMTKGAAYHLRLVITNFLK
jgi:hypothetical protein